jgi:hypothetical protein
MSAAPAEPIKIGPALRESAAVAVRHWPIVLLGLAALCVWAGLILVAVTGCTSTLACLAPRSPSEDDAWMRMAVWLGTRFIGWFILGGLTYRILTLEAGRDAVAMAQRDPRLRLLLACVFCFAGGSLTVFAARAMLIFGSSALGDPAGDLTDGFRPISFAVEGAIAVLVWSYLSARFAVFAAFILRRGDSLGFGRSWSETAGTRLPLILMFGAIHLPLVTIQGLIYYVAPRVLDPNGFAGLVMYPPYAAAGGAMTAGIFVAIFRRLAGREVQIFD